MNLIYVFLGGGIGAVLRYLLTQLIGKSNGHQFPFNTFITNLLGCFLIGLLFSYFFKTKLSEPYTLFWIVGILGGFTTFSSFGLEFVTLLRNGHIITAFSYALLSNLFGISLAFIGLQLTK
jgi:CrcB protein